jgi:hypothetical protein
MPNPATPTMNFDRPKTKRLRAAYTAATAAGQDQFDFDGHALLTAYAKYLLDYLDNQFRA